MALSALGLMVLSAVVDRRVNALHVTLLDVAQEATSTSATDVCIAESAHEGYRGLVCLS